MGGLSSKQAELEARIRTCAVEFQKAHCLLDNNATTDAIVFMEAFITFACHMHNCELTICTAQWIAQLIQAQCPTLRFIGNNPRTFKNPYVYTYTFCPIVVLGVTLINLQQLWPCEPSFLPTAANLKNLPPGC